MNVPYIPKLYGQWMKRSEVTAKKFLSSWKIRIAFDIIWYGISMSYLPVCQAGENQHFTSITLFMWDLGHKRAWHVTLICVLALCRSGQLICISIINSRYNLKVSDCGLFIGRRPPGFFVTQDHHAQYKKLNFEFLPIINLIWFLTTSLSIQVCLRLPI